MHQPMAGHAYDRGRTLPPTNPTPKVWLVMAGDDSTPEPPPAETPKTVIAALGPKMLALAGSHTGGAHPYLVSAAHTQEARRILGPGKLSCPSRSMSATPTSGSSRASVASTQPARRRSSERRA